MRIATIVGTLTYFVILLTSGSAFGNGGSIHSSLFRETGNIKIINSDEIVLEQEHLEIRFKELTTAKVSVAYHLRNEGKTESILYAFPIDYLLHATGEPIVEEFTTVQDFIAWTDFRMSFNGKQIAIDTIALENYSVEHNSYFRDSLARAWFVAKFDFAANTSGMLKIDYSVPTEYSYTDFQEPEYEHLLTTSNNYAFTYDLYPARCWKGGSVGKLSITIFPPLLIDNIDTKVSLLKPKVKTRDTISYFSKDYKFTAKSKIRITYNDHYLASYGTLISSNVAREAIQKLTVSSTLAGNYNKDHLIDGDLRTAWVEGTLGSGVNEWIEFELNTSFVLTGIAIINGYIKSKKAYEENNRIKTGRCQIIGMCNYKNKDRTLATDCRTETVFHLEPFISPERTVESNIASIEFLNYKPLEGEELYYYSIEDKLEDRINFIHPQKIRLYVDEVYQGTKYQDLCVTEILLFGTFLN